MVTRGSQGDIYPYLILADTLIKAGHEISISLPQVFEEQAKAFKLNYVLQTYDDINSLLENSKNNRDLLGWMRRVTDQQFKEFIPILEKNDLLITSNTEFAAPHIAEYCKKPIIRTAFGPFLPSRKIPPPVMPWPRPNPIIRPPALWAMLNLGVNVLTVGIINRNRKELGLPPFRDQGEYAPSHAENFMMYSPSLGSVDPDWKYPWHIGGYLFNDALPYDEKAFQDLRKFIKKDDKPVLFFTLGSCRTKKREQICSWLLEISRGHGYKFVVGSGFSHMGKSLAGQEDVYILDSFIPHHIVFPLFDGIVHHGGAGTTHSAARAGKPQMVLPIFIDQHYWGNQVYNLKIGPDFIGATHVKKALLEKRVVDLMGNPLYKTNAASMAEKVNAENGIQALCEFVKRYGK
ncbi:glycosyl transferase [Spirochaetia bacterium]|nr:glycosyl transferase [Spirochaetia bacterium]